jgi:hypothetical protein
MPFTSQHQSTEIDLALSALLKDTGGANPSVEMTTGYAGTETVTLNVGGVMKFSTLANLSAYFESVVNLNDLADVTLTSQLLGDVLYASSDVAWVNLAGNITTTRKFLRQTGNGSISAAPAWDTLTTADIPDLSATYSVVGHTHSYQPSDATLTAIAALGDAAGALTNDGAGNLSWLAAGASAPVDATYIVQTANGSLSNEQALGALGTGLLKNTTTTGVLSVITDSSTVGQVLRVTGASTYAWGALDLADTDAVTGVLAATNGGTGNAFFAVTGPATATKTFTFPNASATVLTTNALVTSAQGGTGNGFTLFSGPATAEKTFTLPNASATILTTNAAVTVAQGGTGVDTLTGLLRGNGTGAFTVITTSSTVGQCLRVTGVDTYAWGALDLADTDAVTGILPAGNGGTGLAFFAAAGPASTVKTMTFPNANTTIVGTDTTQTLTNKRIDPRVQAESSNTSVTLASDTYDMHCNTALAGAVTYNAPTGTPVNGQRLIIRIKDNGTARAITWNAAFRAIGITLPTTTVLSKTHYIGFIWNSADSKWDGIAVVAQA